MAKKSYRVSITDRYAMEYIVEASKWHTAVSRALQEWEKGKGKGNRTEVLRIRAIKGSGVLREG